MLYGTGGLAYGKVSASDNATLVIDIGDGPVTGRTRSATQNEGWMDPGRRVEGALFDTRNWTWKVEYLYVDLGSLSGSGAAVPIFGTYNWSARFTDNIVRVGLNYRLLP